MKQISLGKSGKFALVDDEDFGYLNQWNWTAWEHHGLYYAVRRKQNHIILMHRLILRLKVGDGIQVDHRNRNGLDNQKYNLRRATTAQNIQNSKARDGTSIYKGVCWWCGKWRAYIAVNRKQINLGRFVLEIEAARAYDRAALKYFGEFACLNFSRKDYKNELESNLQVVF